MNLCISNLPCILLFSYLLKKSFHLNVQNITIILEVDLAVPHCQLCNMCVWYSLQMLNAIFQICSLTVAQVLITLFLDEKYFRLFYCNS